MNSVFGGERSLPPSTSRVERLRGHVLDHPAPPSPAEPALWHSRSWLATSGEPWTLLRRARVTASILRGLTPIIDEDELIVGKFCHRSLSCEETAELEHFRETVEPTMAPVWGQRAHMAVDLDKLLCLGIDGLRREIEDRRAELDIALPRDLEREAFYRSCLIALDGVVHSARR